MSRLNFNWIATIDITCSEKNQMKKTHIFLIAFSVKPKTMRQCYWTSQSVRIISYLSSRRYTFLVDNQSNWVFCKECLVRTGDFISFWYNSLIPIAQTLLWNLRCNWLSNTERNSFCNLIWAITVVAVTGAKQDVNQEKKFLKYDQNQNLKHRWMR